MFPSIDPRQMQKMMKQLGVKQDNIEAVRVIIQTKDKELVFENPSVMRVNMMGKDSYQIEGKPVERELNNSASINHDDVKTVAEQANVSESMAMKTLIKNNGDIAASILELTTQ